MDEKPMTAARRGYLQNLAQRDAAAIERKSKTDRKANMQRAQSRLLEAACNAATAGITDPVERGRRLAILFGIVKK